MAINPDRSEESGYSYFSPKDSNPRTVDLIAARRECEDLGAIGLRFAGGRPDSILLSEGTELLNASSRAFKAVSGDEFTIDESLVTENHISVDLFVDQVLAEKSPYGRSDQIKRHIVQIDGFREILKGLDEGKRYPLGIVKNTTTYLINLGETYMRLSRFYSLKMNYRGEDSTSY
ncbi:MAG TPA: hypothetical protein VHE53_05380 [Patescibacteria group bacterium]|nr:hypothetical protein [Patescibacteria group bacterium]